VKQAGSLPHEAPEVSRGVTCNNRAKPSWNAPGKMEVLSERQRKWQCFFKPRKPLTMAGLKSRRVGKGVMGRDEIHIQIVSCSLLHPVV